MKIRSQNTARMSRPIFHSFFQHELQVTPCRCTPLFLLSPPPIEEPFRLSPQFFFWKSPQDPLRVPLPETWYFLRLVAVTAKKNAHATLKSSEHTRNLRWLTHQKPDLASPRDSLWVLPSSPPFPGTLLRVLQGAFRTTTETCISPKVTVLILETRSEDSRKHLLGFSETRFGDTRATVRYPRCTL